MGEDVHKRSPASGEMEAKDFVPVGLGAETIIKDEAGTDDTGASAHINKRFLVFSVHFNAFLYSTCFWVQLNTLPYLSRKLGADPVVFGYLQTTFAIVQLCGGPLFGRFGDVFGSRAALALAFISAAVSYAVLGAATSVPMLFLSRLPSIFMHAMQGTQMVVTDVSDEEGRAGALGRLGVSYALGMIVGPFIGGIITKQFNEQIAAFVAASLSTFSILLVLKLVPKNTKILASCKDSNTQDDSVKSSGNIFSPQKILELLSVPTVLYLMIVKIITGVPFGIFQSMFSLVAMDYFKLGPQQNGFIMSYVGFLTIIVQGLGVGFLSKRFGESVLLKWSIAIIALAYALLYQVTTVRQLCVVLLPMVVGGCLLNVVTTSVMTKAVSIQDTGTVLGLSMAANSLIRSVSPTLGGIMFKAYGWPIFGAFGFVVNIAMAIFLFVLGRDKL